ncbi:MAG TPA: DUF6152 family protein [Gammaproteobacteria bacterium]
MKALSTRALPIVAAIVISAVPVQAHHSVNGQFDVNSRLTLTGTVSRIDWVNPHTYIYLDVVGDDGAVTTWALESAPTARLRRGGLTKEDLAGKPGEQVTVVGMPALKEGNNSIWLIKIAYEDGKYYILHDSPVEVPASTR